MAVLMTNDALLEQRDRHLRKAAELLIDWPTPSPLGLEIRAALAQAHAIAALACAVTLADHD